MTTPQIFWLDTVRQPLVECDVSAAYVEVTVPDFICGQAALQQVCDVFASYLKLHRRVTVPSRSLQWIARAAMQSKEEGAPALPVTSASLSSPSPPSARASAAGACSVRFYEICRAMKVG